MNQSTRKNWLQRIDANTQLVVELFGALDVEILNRKPSAEKWSIAQNLDHIITINRSYDPIIHSIRTGTLNLAFIARFPFLVRWIGKLILNSVDPTRRKKSRPSLCGSPPKVLYLQISFPGFQPIRNN